jgi:putative colanic acid biosynthesis UDP-glucose lipid carrier transferase
MNTSPNPKIRRHFRRGPGLGLSAGVPAYQGNPMRDRPFAFKVSYAPLIAVIDLILVVASGFVAYWLRFGQLLPRDNFLALIAATAVLVVLCLNVAGMYHSHRGAPLTQILSHYTIALIAPFSLVFAFLIFTKTAADYSRIWLLAFIVCIWTSGVLYRTGHFYLFRYLRSRGRNLKNVIIVSLDPASLPDNFIPDAHESGYQPVKIVALYNSQGYFDPESLPDLVESCDAGEIWFCLPLSLGNVIKDATYALRRETVDIRFLPEFDDMQLLNHRASEVAGRFSLDLSYTPLDGSNAFLKRLEDIVVGAIISVVILPFCAVIALLVKLSSPGPVIYKQMRHGLGGKPIKVYKFRTMKLHTEDTVFPTQARKDDPRFTRIGAFLRRTSLDELPQFFNVLQGRMSIVGPRPHALAHNEYYMDLVQSYMWRHKVKPGITGWAQVNGLRGETDTVEKMQRRVEYDLNYINNWSLLLDLKIILLTIITGFTNPNAY